MQNKDFSHAKINFHFPLAYFYLRGGSDNSGIEQNVSAPPAQSQPALQSTTDTIVADGHTFAMFKSMTYRSQIPVQI